MVTFKFCNGDDLEVEEAVAAESAMYAECMMGIFPNVIVEPRFSVQLMSTILDYCRKHTIDRPSNEEDLEKWVTRFLDVDTRFLCQILVAADFFRFEGLLDKILSRVVEMIKGKSPEEIRELLYIKNDFTPQEESVIRDNYPWAFQSMKVEVGSSSGHASFNYKKAKVEDGGDGTSPPTFNMRWDYLEESLYNLLMERIEGLTSYIRFGAVCRQWQSVAARYSDRFKPVPWLMLRETPGSKTRQFYDMSTKEIYELFLPYTRRKKILGSNFGFLIAVDTDGGFTAIDPTFPMEYILPSWLKFQSQIQNPVTFLDGRQVRDLFALKAACSPAPLFPQPSKDSQFTAMVINLNSDTTCLSYCMPFQQVFEWNFFKKLKLRWIDYVKDRFIAVSFAGSVYECHATPEPSIEHLGTIPHGNIGPCSFYTVEFEGKILFVKKNIWTPQTVDQWHGWEKWDGTSDCYHTQSFQLYEFKEKEIVEIHSIGNYTLFVGYNNAICLPNASCYERNSIYFTDDYHEGIFSDPDFKGGQDMGVFCLDDRSIKPHYPHACKSKFSLPIWIIPNLNKKIDC